MKKAFLIVFTLLFSLVSFAQGFVLNGTLKGSKSGKATLRLYFKDGNEQLDSCGIEKDGKFYFRGQITESIPALLTLNGKKTWRLYLEPGKTITFELNPSGKKKQKIKGSPLTDEWYSVVSPQGREDYDVHLERLDNWVINHPEHIFCADIISNFLAYKWNYDELSRSLNTLKGEALNTYYYRHLTKRLQKMQNLRVGAKAPDFTSSDLQGKSCRFSTLCRGSEYTLLVFWASWSKASREMNPSLVSAYKRFKGAGLNIVSVSLDEDAAAWKQAVREDKLEWTQLCEKKKWDSKAAEAYMLKAVPYNVLVDSEGEIVAFNLTSLQLSQRLSELLESEGFIVEGEIAGLDEGVINMDLLKEGGQKQRLTSKIVNGKFFFAGAVDKTCMAMMTLPVRSGELSFFLNNDHITVSGNVQDLNSVEISGSESNDEFLRIANRCNGQKNPVQCLLNYVLENPQSIYSPFIITSFVAPYLSDAELNEAFAQLEGEAKTMYQYDLLKKHVSQSGGATAEGEKVKDFTLSNEKGEPVQLSKTVAANKYTLIHFWASWDAKSVTQIKNLRNLKKKYSSNGFDIVSVSLDEDAAAWTRTIKAEAMRWVNLSDLKRWNSIIVKLYNLETIPQNILVDREGRVIARNLSAEDLDRKLLLMISNKK